MRVSWKTIYALCCVFFLLLLPFVYADESVDVNFTKDGAIVNEPEVGETLTLTSKLVSANSSDYLKFSLQDSNLKFIDNPNGSSIDVYGRFVDNIWVYETKVEVIGEDPILPKAQVIRDSTQPDLSESEKPQTLNIDLNSEQVVSPGDLISAKAILEPVETVNKTYFNFIKWHVTYSDEELELDNNSGESLSFKIPEDAINETIEISAEILGSECGLNEDLKAKAVKLKVQDNSLSVQIFPSTDSEGIIKGKFIGFSSEILRNGKVAESSVSENSEYTWEAKIGDEFINGQKDNRTNYAVSPDRVGTLTVSLTVTLKNGLTLKSQTVTKTVVEEEQSLQSITLRKIENGESIIGEQVEVTKEFEPQYVTNLEGATYKWIATQDEKVIASSDKSDNFIFTPDHPGSISVELEITPKDSDSISSEVLVVNVLEKASEEPDDYDKPINESDKNQETSDELEDKENSSTVEPSETVEDTNQNQESSNSKEPIQDDQSQNGSSDNQKSSQTTNSNQNNSEPLEILSGILQSNPSSANVGDNIIMNARLSTKGKDGDVEYSWKATDKEGNVLKESNKLKDFTFTSKKPGEVDVSFSVVVKNNQTNSIEEPSFQRLDLMDSVNFSDKAGVGSVSDTDSNKGTFEENNSNNSSKSDLDSTEKDNKDLTNIDKKDEGVSTESELGNSESYENESEKVVSSESEKKDLAVTETNLITQQNNTTEDGKNGIGLSTSSLNTNNPTTISSTKASTTIPVSSTSSSVLNKSSNIVNPKTGIDLTIGQVSVITVCLTLIVISIGIFIRKIVSLFK